jgi:phosphinothricin acetyltransferase
VGITIRDAVAADVPAITDIQNALLDTTTVEWRTEHHTPAEKSAWLRAHQHAGHAVLVAVDDTTGDPGEVVGWAAYHEFRPTDRWPGYRFTVENTVHVREGHGGAGIGRSLMLELIERARAAGRHRLIAAVTAENEASVRFHERLGFVEVGRLGQVGSKLGRWLDVVFLQLDLDDAATPPPDDVS